VDENIVLTSSYRLTRREDLWFKQQQPVLFAIGEALKRILPRWESSLFISTTGKR